MSSRSSAAAWTGVGAGAGAAVATGVLLHRALMVALEISRYAHDVADTAEAVRANADVVGQLARLRIVSARMRAACGESVG